MLMLAGIVGLCRNIESEASRETSRATDMSRFVNLKSWVAIRWWFIFAGGQGPAGVAWGAGTGQSVSGGMDSATML